MAQARSLICVLMGHVDHGKTSILDFVRGTSVAKNEAGGITQAISSAEVTAEKIRKICGSLLAGLRIKLTVPGILFIDSPGHAAFTNLRKRGGSIADIAILVTDINEGVLPQTVECIGILKTYKTPFVVAANKIDKISGWKSQAKILVENIAKQSSNVQTVLDTKLYELVGKIYDRGFNAERFDRVTDYTKQVAIVPVSAKTGEGIPELLMVVSGLAQKFLEHDLRYDADQPASGTILEVKDEKGLGQTMDAIIYDGTIKKGDAIIIAGVNTPILTKVKGLFKFERGRFMPTNQVYAAVGVKINAPEINDVVPGMPLKVIKGNIDALKKEIQKEVSEVIIETDKEGIIVKADSLGSLEALINILKEKDIKIKIASIGSITKSDISIASAEANSLNKVVLGFNVKSVESKEIKVILGDVIYKILETYEQWINAEKIRLEGRALEKLARPSKILLISGYVFRQSNPAIAGVKVLCGTLQSGAQMIKANGDKSSYVKSIQLNGANISEAETGSEIAVSFPHLTIGRQINEKDILYSDIPEADFIKLKKLKQYLSNDEIELLKEFAEIKRRQNPMWGV